jgi:O-antigen/teichoic acid export membrane protein
MPSPPHSRQSEDGRDRFGRNVAYAWGGYLINVISGFLVPRLINDRLGQFTLGIWDFAWSLVSYFGLVQLGMGGSISRYVAHYRAKGDLPRLNRSVSTIAFFQRAVGWLSLVLAAAFVWWFLPFFGDRLGGALDTARWVLFFLGAEVALCISLSVYGAVIVGCHRWDLHNTVSAGAYAAVTFGMIAVLLAGGGLRSLAMVHCVLMVASELVRRGFVGRVCPELRIERRLTSWAVLKEQARYSVKSLIPSISNLLSNQVLSVLITGFLGPPSLAVFSRSRGLMTTLRTLAVKFGMIVVPTASALRAKNDHQALRDTLLTAPAILSSLALPVLVTIAVAGDPLICLWMGDAYVFHGLVPILCIGTYATVVQEPVWSILSGMNLHGRMALVKLGVAVGSAVLLAAGLWLFHWGLLGAAVCFALPQLLVDGLVMPWHACGLVGVSKSLFLWKVFVRPAGCALPYAIAVGGVAMLGRDYPMGASCAMIVGSALSVVAYARWLVPPGFFRRALPAPPIRTAELPARLP